MKKIFFITALSLIFISCTTNKTERDINTYISKNIMADAQSVIMETTREDITPDKIKITDMFGDAQNPFTGEKYFRDYVSYPYYSIRKFCSALDGVITKIDCPTNYYGDANLSIIVKTEELEIEYIGLMKINPDLALGDKINKGTYLATMLGGGDSGMVLSIRMRYNGEVINPAPWF